MADKCITLCADHLCIHNSCSGYYGVCALSALSVAARYGITRTYMETCPNKEPIPNCIARGPGKIAVFSHGRAGNGKSTLELEQALRIMASSAVELKPITMDEVFAAIELVESVPKPEIREWSPSEFERTYTGIWHIGEEEE